jgi:hypothetical protein
MQQPSPDDSQMYDLAEKPMPYVPLPLVLNCLPPKSVELQALIANAFVATMDATAVKTNTSRRNMVIICERVGELEKQKTQTHGVKEKEVRGERGNLEDFYTFFEDIRRGTFWGRSTLMSTTCQRISPRLHSLHHPNFNSTFHWTCPRCSNSSLPPFQR